MAADILATLEGAGCRVGLRDGRLVVDGPTGDLGGEIRAAIASQRDTVAALVRAVAADVPPDSEGIRWATPTDFPRSRVPAFPRNAVERERWVADPRPDLADDSGWWGALLMCAYAWDGWESAGLFAGLHYLRCGGARLTEQAGALRLTPGSCLANDYDAIRAAVLFPQRVRVADWLARLDQPAAKEA